MLNIIRELGGGEKRYTRERRRAVRGLVSEIYSPPRVTNAAKLLPEFGCVPGFALDITTVDENGEAWDFNRVEQRRKARELVLQDRPLLLIGSPMCTRFSAWQRINDKKRDPSVVAKEHVRAMVHIKFVMELYQLQAGAGRYLLHGHPAQASSWEEDVVRKTASMDRVRVVVGDQCQYGAEGHGHRPSKKPTKLMTNSEHIAAALSKRCKGRFGNCSRHRGGEHLLCNGETAKRAAIYPFELC